MVNSNLWALRREMMTPKNECDNQISNNQQSANGHFRTPQAMMSQRPQNQLMGVNNFTQERCYQNNIADATTLSMSSFSSARNNTPIIPSYRASLARYGRTLPSDLPQPQVNSGNTPISPSYRASLARYGRTLPSDLPQPQVSSGNTPISPSYRASLARYGRTLPSDLPQPQVSSGNTPISPSYQASLAQYGRTLPSDLPQPQVSSGNTPIIPSYQARTLSSDLPHPQVSSGNTPIIPSYRASLARYGRTLPSDLPQPQVSSSNTPIIPSFRANLARNSWSNSCLGSQGSADSFRNSSRTNLHKQKNFRYHPYEEGSNHKNDSSVFNDFDPLSRVDMNSFQNLENYVAPIATSAPMCPSGNTNLDSTRESTFPSYLGSLAQNSSSSCLGSQGFANNFRNPSKPNLLNQKNFRYHPYGEGSNHKNDSFVFNDFDPLSRVDMNSFRNLKNYVAPIATPTPIRPSDNLNLDLTLAITTEHHNLKNHVAPIATPPPIRPSGNANLDLTPERTTERRMLDIPDTDAWKRLMACPNGCYEEIQNQKKELLLFKDDKNTFPTSLVIESGDEQLDLDLKLHL